MKRLLVAAVLFLVPAIGLPNWAHFQASSPSSSCNTLPGLTCDANGWTVFSISSNGFGEGNTYNGNGNRIVYVAAAPTGNDANDGSFAHPVASPSVGLGMLRNNKPDWLLFRCGDTWTDQSIGAVSSLDGVDNANPVLFSSYDGNAAHNPPVPDPTSCSSQPLFNLTSTYYATHNCPVCTQGGGVNFSVDHIAIVGLNFQAYRRNFDGCCFNLTDSQTQMGGFDFGLTLDGMLLEDCSFGFFTGNSLGGAGISGSINFIYQRTTNVFFRRNRVYGSYSNNNGNLNAVGISPMGNGPVGYVLYENLVDFDYNTKGSITWAPPSGRNHTYYINEVGLNGDFGSFGTPVTAVGNIVSNDGSAPQFRLSGIVTGNAFIQNPFNIVTGNVTASYVGSLFTGNVIVNSVLPSPPAAAAMNGVDFTGRDVQGINPPTSNTWTFSSNFLVNSPNVGSVSDQGFLFNAGAQNLTISGNVVWNYAYGAPSSNWMQTTQGSLFTFKNLTAGSGYTDIPVSFSATESGNSFGGNILGTNYIVATVASNTLFPSTGACAFKEGAGAVQAGSQFSCSPLDATHIVIYGSTCDAACLASTTGTIYLPYYNVTLSCVSCAGSPSAGGASIISAGGQIVFVGIGGADIQSGGLENIDAPGSGYTNGDILTASAGASCQINSGNCPHGFGGGTGAGPATGSGFQITVDSVATNTVQSSGCNPASNNVLDGSATTCVSFSDPARTTGSYYSTLSGATANATFTASVDANGVMNVTSVTSGTLNINDAITFSGQTKQDFIKADSTHNAALCNHASANCTGAGTTGTYQLAISTNVGAGTFHSYTAQQFLNGARAVNKQNWSADIAYTACGLNKYIKAGFGVTDTCSP